MEEIKSPQTGLQTEKSNPLIALIVASLALFAMTFMGSSLNIALPAIGLEFRADAIILGWIVTSYLLTVVVFLIPFSRLADLIGLKKIMICGVIIFAASLIGAMFSVSITMLIALRVLQGIGSAMVMGNAIAMVTAVYPANRRGVALGISTGVVYAGASVGPFLGGIITEHLGWRDIFLVSIVLLAVVIVLLFWKLKGEWCSSRGEKFDYGGSLIYGLAMITLVYGLSRLPEIIGGVLIFVGIAGIVAFFYWESRVSSPVVEVKLFRNSRSFTFSNLAALISYAAVYSVAFLLSLYLQYVKALTPDQAGLIMVIQPVMQAVLSPFTGRLSDKVEPRLVATAGMGLTTLGVISLAFLGERTSLVQIIITLAVLGIGFSLFSSPNVSAIMGSVTPKYYGVASAMSNTVRSVGQMLSMGITMTVIAVVVGHVEITARYYPAFISSTRISFGIFAVLCLGGIFASLSRGKMR